MVLQDFLTHNHGVNPFGNGFSEKSDPNFRKRNEVLMNFAYIVSHNLRSHSGNLSTLLKIFKDSASEKEREKVFEYVVNLSEQLCETVKNLGKVVSEEETSTEKLETIDIRLQVEETAKVLAAEIQQHSAKIHSDIPPLTTVTSIPAYVESVVLNMMSNAIKYRHPERDPEITFQVTKKPDFLILQISDNGIGIDLQKYGDKLFGKNQTFHGNKDAIGIGLYMTKNQIESLGGKIEVESEVGKGTTFNVYFPIAE